MILCGVFFNSEIRTGGHRRYLELLGGLAARNHAVHLLRAPESGAAPAGVRCIDISSVAPSGGVLPRRHSASWKRAVDAERDRIRGLRPRPEVVLAFDETTFPGAWSVARMLEIPLVLAVRSNMLDEISAFGAHVGPSALSRLLAPLERAVILRRQRRIARLASAVVFQTEYDRRSFLRHHSHVAADTYVIPNNIGASWFDPAYEDANTSTACRTLLFVGALSRRKGLFPLLDAVRRLREGGRRVKLRIVGFGALEDQVAAAVERLGLTEEVELTGRVPSALPYISQADLLVLPSYVESFPNVLLEALFVGTPAVGSRVGGIREILSADELLFEPGSASEIESCVARLHDDTNAYRRAKAICARRKDAFRFDWIARFEDVISGAVSRARDESGDGGRA
ncbi:MAG: glycosyltransferase family 4 protein [Spirochaetota bacterium]